MAGNNCAKHARRQLALPRGYLFPYLLLKGRALKSIETRC
jgi:hypothetical protein